MPTADIIIIGGGIIGCSIAYRLAREGLSVTVLDRDQPGQEASRAAAGLLAPQSEIAHEPSGPFFELCYRSRQLYPDFVADVEEASGLAVEYRTEGSLFLAYDFAEGQILSAALEKQMGAGLAVEDLTADELRAREPALSENIPMALYIPGDHQVNNQRLMRALVIAAERRGVRFLSGTPVIGLLREGDRVVGVRTNRETFSAATVINCAGAWASTVDPIFAQMFSVTPIRGQIVVLEASPPLFRHVIYSAECYVAPRRDGRMLIGSTMEMVGFDKSVTAEAVLRLLQAVEKMSPGIARCRFVTAWAGLRPDTPDHWPILGAMPLGGLLVATGHFRNGILLAPITAHILSELVLTGGSSLDLTPFSPLRFSP